MYTIVSPGYVAMHVGSVENLMLTSFQRGSGLVCHYDMMFLFFNPVQNMQ